MKRIVFELLPLLLSEKSLVVWSRGAVLGKMFFAWEEIDKQSFYWRYLSNCLMACPWMFDSSRLGVHDWLTTHGKGSFHRPFNHFYYRLFL